MNPSAGGSVDISSRGLLRVPAIPSPGIRQLSRRCSAGFDMTSDVLRWPIWPHRQHNGCSTVFDRLTGTDNGTPALRASGWDTTSPPPVSAPTAIRRTKPFCFITASASAGPGHCGLVGPSPSGTGNSSNFSGCDSVVGGALERGGGGTMNRALVDALIQAVAHTSTAWGTLAIRSHIF
ncbi:hypothetical protein FQR65_LT16358 [Abscondita terminalis]|nr:hypothetical protein FQR65_LT16358 [Abscondita terminalis]